MENTNGKKIKNKKNILVQEVMNGEDVYGKVLQMT